MDLFTVTRQFSYIDSFPTVANPSEYSIKCTSRKGFEFKTEGDTNVITVQAVDNGYDEERIVLDFTVTCMRTWGDYLYVGGNNGELIAINQETRVTDINMCAPHVEEGRRFSTDGPYISTMHAVDDRLISVDVFGAAKVWNLLDHTCNFEFKMGSNVASVSWDPEFTHVFTIDVFDKATIYDAASGIAIRKFRYDGAGRGHIPFISADENMFAITVSGGVRVFTHMGMQIQYLKLDGPSQIKFMEMYGGDIDILTATDVHYYGDVINGLEVV